jgi:CMP-N,N'-diacetyllegionaminic acid synthase
LNSRLKIVSVILARGGSKGIPGKNIMDVCGKPLLWYTINASQQSQVHETWVSTNDKKIKNVTLRYNCNVLDRPNNLSIDSSKSENALIHFVNKVECDILVFIQPTSPLLCSGDINKGLKLMEKYDSVFSAYKEHWVPRWDENVRPVNWEINNRPMRQDVVENFVENGAFYITTRSRLLKSGVRYSGKIGIYTMPFCRSFQVDTMDDMAVIIKMLKHK